MTVQEPNSSYSYILLNKVLLTKVPFIMYLLLHYIIRIYYHSCNRNKMTRFYYLSFYYFIKKNKNKNKAKNMFIHELRDHS